MAVSKEALGAEAGGGRGVVEIALNRDKGLLSVIQHQPFYSSCSMHIMIMGQPWWIQPARGFQSLSAGNSPGKNARGTEHR